MNELGFGCCEQAEEARSDAVRIMEGVHIGRLVGLTASGPLLRIAASPEILPGRTVVDLGEDDIDRELVIAFESGNLRKPIVLGCLRRRDGWNKPALQLDADGEKLVLSARERIVLECGDASITLTRSGKVLIRGHYVQSRATGLNSVKGGTVELN